jgi:hypothetical protein
VKGYVLWRRDESPVVRRDREGDDRLRLVASLEDLVPVGAEIAGLVIDEGERWDARPVAEAGAAEAGVAEAGIGALDALTADRPLAPVVPIFGDGRTRRRRHHR